MIRRRSAVAEEADLAFATMLSRFPEADVKSKAPLATALC
jgi:hypothetical protein